MLQAGRYRLDLLQTESLLLDGGAMFGVIPKILWSRHFPADERNLIRFSTRPLLIRTGKQNVLVDAGIGTKGDAKFQKIYGVSGSSLSEALAAIGVPPASITDVVLTHLHFDHCGGLTRMDAGKSIPILPNARYLIQRKALETAQSPNPREKASFMPENIEPLLKTGRVESLDGPHCPAPGIELIPQSGHTEAMQIVRIAAEDRTFIYPCDTAPTGAHVRIPWIAAYDMQPLLTMIEKEQLWREAVPNRTVIFFAHDPEIGAATILWNGKHYQTDQTVET